MNGGQTHVNRETTSPSCDTPMSSLWRRMPWRLKNWPPAFSVGQLAVALVLVTALPLLALIMLMYNLLVSDQRMAVRDGMMSTARSMASLVDNEIDTHLAIATALANSPSLVDQDLTAFREQAIRALSIVPGTWLNLAAPDGTYVLTTLSDTPTPLRAPAHHEIMEKAWATGQPQVSDVALGPVSKRITAILEYPVFKNGAPLYSIVIALPPARFQALIENKIRRGAVVGVVDRRMNFVARIPDFERRVGTPASEEWRAAIALAPENVVEVMTIEQQRSLTAYTQTRLGWTVGISEPVTVIEAPIRRLLVTMGLIGAVLVGLSLALGLGLARYLTQILTRLAADSAALGRGEIVTPTSDLPLLEATAISQSLSSSSMELAKRASHQEFLLRELAHRTKNLLAVTQAMVGQTARNSKSLAEFRDKYGERLAGLGRSVALLVEQDWTGVPLSDLVQRQVEAFAPEAARLVCAGPEVMVNADAAQSLGLALHELATNAVKYGAWSTPTGFVDVTWALKANGAAAPRLSMTWRETGGPPVEAPTKQGFGRTVMESMVAQKLDGEVRIDYASEGLQWSLSAPGTFIVQPSGAATGA